MAYRIVRCIACLHDFSRSGRACTGTSLRGGYDSTPDYSSSDLQASLALAFSLLHAGVLVRRREYDGEVTGVNGDLIDFREVQKVACQPFADGVLFFDAERLTVRWDDLREGVRGERHHKQVIGDEDGYSIRAKWRDVIGDELDELAKLVLPVLTSPLGAHERQAKNPHEISHATSSSGLPIWASLNTVVRLKDEIKKIYPC